MECTFLIGSIKFQVKLPPMWLLQTHFLYALIAPLNHITLIQGSEDQNSYDCLLNDCFTKYPISGEMWHTR